MHLQNIPEPPKIRVVVRKRPITQHEGQARDIVDVEGVGGLAVKEIKYVTQWFSHHYFNPIQALWSWIAKYLPIGCHFCEQIKSWPYEIHWRASVRIWQCL